VIEQLTTPPGSVVHTARSRANRALNRELSASLGQPDQGFEEWAAATPATPGREFDGAAIVEVFCERDSQAATGALIDALDLALTSLVD
jgi:hypothetical protein